MWGLPMVDIREHLWAKYREIQHISNTNLWNWCWGQKTEHRKKSLTIFNDNQCVHAGSVGQWNCTISSLSHYELSSIFPVTSSWYSSIIPNTNSFVTVAYFFLISFSKWSKDPWVYLLKKKKLWKTTSIWLMSHYLLTPYWLNSSKVFCCCYF